MTDRSQLDLLTPREREVLTMIAEGDSLPEIAGKLHRSLKTIESHRLSLGRKLEASNRVELAKIAITAGLISIDAGKAGKSADAAAERELSLLRAINESVEAKSGRAFIDALCLALARVLDVRFAAVCIAEDEGKDDARYTVSYCENDTLGIPFSYNAAHKPVLVAAEQGVCKFGPQIQDIYSSDPFVIDNDIRGYIGIRLEGDRQISTGVLALAHDQPIEDLDTYERVLRFFGARTAAELEVVVQANRIDAMQQQIQAAPDEAAARRLGLELDWIDRINQAIGQATGRELLERFCQQASLLPDAHIAAICTMDRSGPAAPTPYRRAIMAIARDGEYAEPIRYNAEHTPCQAIIENGQCILEQGIRESYPKDAWLAQLKAEGYLGLQIAGKDSVAIGGVGLISLQSFDDIGWIKRVVEFFIPRLSGALQTCLEIESLRDECKLLASEITDADPAKPLIVQAKNSPSLALAEVNRRVHTLTGPAFLRGIVEAISELFNFSHAGICTLNNPQSPGKLRSVLSFANQQLTDNYEYEISGAPCELTLRHGTYLVKTGAPKAFPQDKALAEKKIDSYLGIRLPNDAGGSGGVFWMACQSPIHSEEAVQHIMSYYSARIGGELVALEKYESLLQKLEQLEPKPGRRKATN